MAEKKEQPFHISRLNLPDKDAAFKQYEILNGLNQDLSEELYEKIQSS